MGDIYADFRRLVVAALEDLAAEGVLPVGMDPRVAIKPPRDVAGLLSTRLIDIDLIKVTVEPPRDPTHGDLSTNAAMVLAGQARQNPLQLAEKIAASLAGRELATADYRGSSFTAEVARPGFINIRLEPAIWHAQLRAILRAGTAYGDSDIGGGKRVNVEFVSANPTGPLHVGHGRGAVFGDALSNLLTKASFDVVREYYINDAGAQIDVLGRSLYLRYLEALGENIGEIPPGLYPGEYLKILAESLANTIGDAWRNKPEEEWLPEFRTFGVGQMMVWITDVDLKALGVEFEGNFKRESTLVASGAVDEVLATLVARGLIYEGVLEPPKGKLPDDWEPRPQLLFRATQFGDEVDRPLKKSDGSWTYFATDIAYHLNKYHRGFDTMIDVWGADHGGYVKRMQAAVKALTEGKATLDVKLCQLVSLFDNGQPVRMSKRAGTFVTLEEVIEKVGKDVFRFIMLTRRNDQALEFDFARVTEQSKDNPVFYVQYAHARACSVMRHAAEEFASETMTDAALVGANLALLSDPSELALIRLLAGWPRMVESAAEAHEPHRLAFYLQEVAAQFHLLWTKGRDAAQLRFIISGDPDLTRARLALVRGVATVVASGLAVFGVTPAEEM